MNEEKEEFFKQECNDWWNELSPTQKDEWVLKHYIKENKKMLEEKWDEESGDV